MDPLAYPKSILAGEIPAGRTLRAAAALVVGVVEPGWVRVSVRIRTSGSCGCGWLIGVGVCMCMR